MRTSSEACILDVVQVVLEGIPSAATESLLTRITLGEVRSFWKGVAVDNNPRDEGGGVSEVGRTRKHATHWYIERFLQSAAEAANAEETRERERRRLRRYCMLTGIKAGMSQSMRGGREGWRPARVRKERQRQKNVSSIEPSWDGGWERSRGG